MSEWHFFGNTQFAGPGPLDMVRFFSEPGLLRSSAPSLILSPYTITKHHENPELNLEISRFWNEYYNGSDWKFICTPLNVSHWLKQGFILVMRDKTNIIGTFVHRTIPGGVVCGKPNSKAAILDGLVIHPAYRGKGLASYLLNRMDYETYRTPERSESILIWFREHETYFKTPLQAPISIDEYCYVLLEKLPYRVLNEVVKPAPREIVTSLIKAVATDSNLTLSSLFFDEIDVKWFLTKSSVIGILDTHRITKSGIAIWEVVFAANLVKPYFTDLQRPIELAASELGYNTGILFASSGLTRGNLSEITTPWRKGMSGYLTTHVYNWMPPKFLTGSILLATTCI